MGKLRIPILFGWIVFHKKEQLTICKYPWLVCHWNKAEWMWCSLYSKRLFCIGRDNLSAGPIDYYDDGMMRE